MCVCQPLVICTAICAILNTHTFYYHVLYHSSAHQSAAHQSLQHLAFPLSLNTGRDCGHRSDSAITATGSSGRSSDTATAGGHSRWRQSSSDQFSAHTSLWLSHGHMGLSTHISGRQSFKRADSVPMLHTGTSGFCHCGIGVLNSALSTTLPVIHCILPPAIAATRCAILFERYFDVAARGYVSIGLPRY